jgi:hypothetical protein
METEKTEKERDLKILIKQKLLKTESNLTKFWKADIKEQCKISYFHFCNMLSGRAQIREDVEKIVLNFLNGR